MAGFHLLGGRLRDEGNRAGEVGMVERDESSAPYGVTHAIVHTDDHAGLATSVQAFVLNSVAPDDLTSPTTAEGNGN